MGLASPFGEHPNISLISSAELARPAPPTVAPPAGVPFTLWSGTPRQVAGRVWSAVCTLWILRIAGSELELAAFGRFTFYLSLFAWLDSFVTLGTGEVAIQRTASDPGAVPAVLAATRRIRVITGVIGLVVIAALGLSFDEPGALWIALAAC